MRGQGFVSVGTSGVILAARDGYRPAPETAVHTFCHAVPGRWYQMGVMLSATDSLNWLARIVGKSPSELTAAMGDTLQGPGSVRFLPYLSGERTPHNDSEIQGSITGVFTDTSVEDLTRGVLEGVAFALRDCFDALTAHGRKDGPADRYRGWDKVALLVAPDFHSAERPPPAAQKRRVWCGTWCCKTGHVSIYPRSDG